MISKHLKGHSAPRVGNSFGPYLSGKLLVTVLDRTLICRPHTLNMYILSKVTYKASVINLRSQDYHAIGAAAKRWACQHLLIKPPEILLYRKAEDDGLGLIQIEARCQAYLIKNFVDQGHTHSKFPNLYLKALYRKFVLHECLPGALKRPSFYSLDFFQTIEEAVSDEPGGILGLTTKQWYKGSSKDQ